MKIVLTFLLLALSATTARGLSFTVLHINDMHARVEGIRSGGGCSTSENLAGECDGGWARLMTAAKKFVDEAAPNKVIFVDNGDQFLGTTWSSFYKGQETYQFLNKFCDTRANGGAGFHACIGGLGNHEFDFGYSALWEYTKMVNYDIVSSNIVDACTENSQGVHPASALGSSIVSSSVVEIDGTKIGFVGYTTTDTKDISSPPDCLTFNDEMQSVKSDITALKNQGCDIIIANGHAGYQKDIEVANDNPDIDFVIGGHSHTFLWNENTMGSVPALSRGRFDGEGNPSGLRQDSTELSYPLLDNDNTPVVQAYYGSRYLGAMELTFDVNGDLSSYLPKVRVVGSNSSIFAGATDFVGGSPVPQQNENKFDEDPAMKALIDSLRTPLDEFQNKEIGYSAMDFETYINGVRIVRSVESPIGNFACDAFVNYMNEATNLPVDICMQNGGGIRADIPLGPVSLGKAIEVFPFGNVLSVLNFSGADVYRAAEVGVGNRAGDAKKSVGSFLHYGPGFVLKYSVGNPSGSRVDTIELNGELIPNDTSKYYSVVTNSYLAGGKDGYDFFPELEVLLALGVAQETALAWYMENGPRPSCVLREGRIVPDVTPPDETGLPLVLTEQDFDDCKAAGHYPGKPTIDFTILHINDFHARVQGIKGSAGCSKADNEAGKCDGGWARLITAAKSFVDEAAPSKVIFVDNGDQFMGTVWSSYYKGAETYQFMNKLCSSRAAGGAGFSACIGGIGNHEFDFGYEALLTYTANANYDIVSSNILDSCPGTELGATIKPRTVVDLGAGAKIGFVGYTTKTTSSISSPPDCVTFSDESTSIQTQIDILKSENISVIIVNGHAGYEEDIRVADANPDVDLIISGHSHTFMWNETTMGKVPAKSEAGRDGLLSIDSTDISYPILDGDNTPIVQAYFAGRYLGAIKLSFNASDGNMISYNPDVRLLGSSDSIYSGATNYNGTGNPEPVNNKYKFEEDAVMEELIDSLLVPLNEYQNQVIGYVSSSMDTNRGTKRLVRSRELPIGNFACDAFLHYINTQTNVMADMCMQNGGGIRAPIAQGEVTLSNAIEVFPFGNVLMVLNMSGADVYSSAEVGVGNRGTTWGDAESNVGSFLHYGHGFALHYDPNLPSGGRVLNITLNGVLVPNDMSEYYNVVTNSYMGVGRGGFDVMGTAAKIIESGASQEDALAEFMQFTCPSCYELEGRIVPVNPPPDEDGQILDLSLDVFAGCDYDQVCPLNAQPPDSASTTLKLEKFVTLLFVLSIYKAFS